MTPLDKAAGVLTDRADALERHIKEHPGASVTPLAETAAAIRTVLANLLAPAVERKPASPELIARGLNLIAAHFSISDYQREWNVRGWPSMSATESEALSEVASEAASLIERLRAALTRQADNMAFILNHQWIGREGNSTWMDKFSAELAEDRQSLEARHD